MTSQLSSSFVKRTEPIEVIFGSYRTLYELYITTLKTANASPNMLKALENCKNTVEKEQKNISTKLYSQAFILLTGTAEAFINDVFDNLIQENFLSIRKASGVNYSVSDLQRILEENEDKEFVSLELANITIKQIHSVKNKSEKINFQNTQSMSTTFKEYFGIDIDLEPDYMKSIHKYWQMRHAIVHTNAKVDERYKHNIEIVGFTSEKIGSKVIVTKKIYEQCKKDFCTLFDKMEELFVESKLSFEGVV